MWYLINPIGICIFSVCGVPLFQGYDADVPMWAQGGV